MADLKKIETGTDFGVVYINRDFVTHITKNFDNNGDGERSLVWFPSGKYVSVQGAPEQVKNVVFS